MTGSGILATGAHGTLGSYLPPSVVRTDVAELDVTNQVSIEQAFDKHQPRAVLHLAAETDVDWCERNPLGAFRVNALGTRNIAAECTSRGITLLYVSTAGVFGGSKAGAYTEFDHPDPANIYGESKLAGESYVRQIAPLSYIARAGWMIGGGPGAEKKFIGKMLAHAQANGKIRAVNDKWGSPTYARDFAAGMLKLIDSGNYGLYHMVNEGSPSRYDVAVEVNRILGSPFEVEAVGSSEFPLPAPRARSEVLRNLVLELEDWNIMPDWKSAVRQYLESEWGGWSQGDKSLGPTRSDGTART